GMLRASGTISGPLADDLSARLSGAWFGHDHTMKNLFVPDDSQDMNRYSIRGQLRYASEETLSVRLILGRFVVDSANTAEFEIDEGLAFAATNAAFGVPCPQSSSADRAFCNNHAVVTDLDASDATLLIDVNRNGYTLSSISGYEEFDTLRDFDADQLNIDVVNIFDRRASESWSQEVRVVSPGDETLEWLGGIFFYRNQFDRGDSTLPSIVLADDAPLLQLPNGLPFGQPGDAAIVTSASKTDHYSIFGSLSWHANEKLILTAGARWQREDKSSVVVNTANHQTPTLITLVLAPSTANADLSRDTEGVSWNLSAQYEWSANVMTYASASRGFKSGGFNAGFSPTPGTGREFEDETVVSYEIGARALLAENRVRLGAAVFHAEYDDFQAAGFVSLRFRVNNAEQVSVSGFELDVAAQIGNGLTASASVSYADAGYDRYTRGACYFNRPPDNADGTGCVLTGSPLYLAPLWKTWLNVEFERPVSFGVLHTGADWTWIDQHLTNATLDPRHVQGPYSLFNARAGLRIGRFDVYAWIDNIDDRVVVLQEGPTNLFGNDPASARFLGAPRAYGLTLSMAW
ncbi:MAG: TonB-dependent receptor, partial [Woeseiaceae bacterium]|nr:TonB-dependent receptor [Woeseiaceae bacterium]